MSKKAEQIIAQVVELMREELEGVMGWWYLSFANGEGFQGAVIVEAKGYVSAVRRANGLGINQVGCEVLGFEVPEWECVPDEAKDRLLSRGDLERIFGELMRMEE